MSQPNPPGPTTTRNRDYTSAIYGSVLAASVILGAGALRPPFELALVLVVTGAIFWLAHVYAETVASIHGGWSWGAIVKGLRHEWPLLFAAIPPAIAAMIAGFFPKLSIGGGSWIALGVALIELQLWGWAAGRAAGQDRSALLRTQLLTLLIGLIIVALKLSVPH